MEPRVSTKIEIQKGLFSPKKKKMPHYTDQRKRFFSLILRENFSY